MSSTFSRFRKRIASATFINTKIEQTYHNKKLNLNYTVYKNGPFSNISQFIFNLLRFWNWHKMNKSWIIWSVKSNFKRLFGKFENPKNEYDYFMKKYSKRLAWFAEYSLFPPPKKKNKS